MCAPAARSSRRNGRTAPAAPSPSRSIRTMRRTSCATAASPSAACRRANTATARACRASSSALAKHDAKATFFVPAVAALLYRGRAAPGRGGGPRDRHPWLDPRAQQPAALRNRARPDVPGGRYPGDDHRRAAGRPAHALLGFQPRARCASNASSACSTIRR